MDPVLLLRSFPGPSESGPDAERPPTAVAGTPVVGQSAGVEARADARERSDVGEERAGMRGGP